MSIYSNSSYYNDIDEEEEEEEDLQPVKKDESYTTRQLTLYAIDCRPSMFVADDYNKIPFYVALQSIVSNLLIQINTRPNDHVGVIFFGTNEKHNMANKDHIYVFQPLDMLDAPRIKELELYLNNESLFQDKFGSSDAVFPISDLFWTCTDILSKEKSSLVTKRVIIITDNDDPTSGNSIYRKSAIQRAMDLKSDKVNLVLLGLDRPNHEFDRVLFYQDVVKFENEEGEEILSNTGELQDLFSRIQTVQASTRSEFKIPFEIAPGLTIGIQGYNMVIEQKIGTPHYFYTNQEQLQEVKTVTRWKCVDSNEYLTKLDMRKAYAYGGEFVLFSSEEIQKMYSIREPSIRVLGFRERKALKAYHQLSHPYFIYPDDYQYKESKAVFLLLLNSLLKKKQIAICSFVKRVNAAPKIVALLPQAEKLDKESNQIDPPGFQMIILPYADEIRSVPPHTVPSEYETGRDIASLFIEKLTLKEGYNAIDYHNPYLDNFKNMIQSIALDEIKEKEIRDQTIPNYKWIELEAANEIEEFKQAVGLDKVMMDDFTHVKRKANEENEDNSGQKKPKLKDRTIPEHWELNSLNLVTNPSLKEFLTFVGIQPKKTKAELIDQIDGYLKSKKEQP